MGIDGKGKEKKSRKRTSSLSSSEDEGRRRKRRRSDDERRNRKSDKKEKRKDKKSHRHHSDKEKKSKDKHKSKRHKGDHHSKSEFQELSNDDYFSKNNEFATWLKEKKKMFFSDLSSESARELFSVFVKDWNSQKLESRYYEGISSAPRSAHNWAFKNKLLNLAMCCRKLSTFKPKPPLIPPIFSRRYTLNPKSISKISLECRIIEEEPTNMNTNRHYGTCVSLLNHPNPEISCFYQKGFSQITKEVTGKALHALCIKGLVNLTVFYSNTLINMYSKFGHIGFSRYLFDKMSERNDASWNNMISGFVRAGSYRESMRFFNEMRDFGVKPSGIAVASLVTACERSEWMLIEGVQVHGFIVKVCLLSDVFVGTSLVHLYGNYGLAADAMKVFQEMIYKNVVSWTALMVAYVDYGEPSMVMNIYRRMRSEGMSCNDNTMSSVISSCVSLENELLGYQVLGHVIKYGLETNVSVANSLISMFGYFGSVEEACYVFSGMDEHDTISWNSMIAAYIRNGLCKESLRCFSWMFRVHKEINSTTLSTMLAGCGSVDNLKWGRGIHSLVLKFGWNSNVCASNTLITMYSDAGRCEDAELVFQGMVEKDMISWNSMMACYAQDGNCLDALKLLATMFYMRRGSNYVTFTSALAACSDPEFATEGKILHALVIHFGLHENVIVGNALVTLYAKSGLMIEAKKVFQTMPKRDGVTWNALIGGHADSEEPDEALKAFKLMREEGVPINYITISNVLGACLAPNDLLEHGMPIHAFIILTGFQSDEYVQNSLITMYAKCGDLNSSNNIFDRLTSKNASAWNAMMAANAHHGHMEEALKFLLEMRRAGVNVDQFSFSECLAAAAKLAILEEGQQLHGLAVKLGCDSNPFVASATMDMYGKCGEIDDVLRIIPRPIDRSRLSWNILTSSFSRHGFFEKAKETFHEMINLGVKPDHVTFVALLSACSHGGMVEEGLAYYDSMIKEFGIPAKIGHCVCIIDLLGRSGRFAEAETFIKEMPVSPTDHVWRSLLAACKTHGNLELGRKAVENLLKLDPSDDSAYVLYSNICATTGKWEDVEKIRRQMGLNKIKKKPACSWVKLKNKWSLFGMGDQSHPQASEIYAKLEELKKMIKEAGYVPDTSYALQDTDEEQKEHNLWNHSERLALAYGLISSPEGSTLKIFKNLRVCGDCHSVYKLVSGILGRKIVLRDPYRFHQFSGGQCSCTDYW
ncbi:putative pentatricopeptide repeat-containing protein At5g09950 [Populus nigra]|uniref:putative pentatricopeptide repeat-containing protein At5g09950 n=1 Tax=Populus nigra TaxID=3691 RepID=UPI002B26FC7F|nr:putative pentatricopeptide repeat-containing protein At5g09950 [Populus nigra]